MFINLKLRFFRRSVGTIMRSIDNADRRRGSVLQPSLRASLLAIVRAYKVRVGLWNVFSLGQHSPYDDLDGPAILLQATAKSAIIHGNFAYDHPVVVITCVAIDTSTVVSGANRAVVFRYKECMGPGPDRQLADVSIVDAPLSVPIDWVATSICLDTLQLEDNHVDELCKMADEEILL